MKAEPIGQVILKELASEYFEKVLPMIADEPPGFLMALAALENPSGRVFVDDPNGPRCALLLSPTGWHTALGVFGNREAEEAGQLIMKKGSLVYMEKYSLNISRLAELGQGVGLIEAAKGEIREREMVVLVAMQITSEIDVSDCRIQDLTLESYKQAAHFNPMLRVYWPDANKLVEAGIAKVFVEDGVTKGICYTCFRYCNIHEPHIVIDEPYRGKGIGKLLTAAYANSILERSYRLFWSHYKDNVASSRCAEAVGFEYYGPLGYSNTWRRVMLEGLT